MLKLIPRSLNPEDPIYDSRPAKTIKTQLKNRAAITRHLVDLYLDGKYKLKDLGKCMDLTGSELRREAYQVVPVHERPDHEYLVAKRDQIQKTHPRRAIYEGRDHADGVQRHEGP